MLWESVCTHFINPYFELYTVYNPPEKGDNAEVNGIGGIINPKGICTVILDLEDDKGKLQNPVENRLATVRWALTTKM